MDKRLDAAAVVWSESRWDRASERLAGARRPPEVRRGSGPGSLAAGAVWTDEDHRRLVIRVIAAYRPVQLRAGTSAGASCMLCRGAIAAGTLQYDIEAGPSTVIVDDSCYMSFLRDVVETPPPSG